MIYEAQTKRGSVIADAGSLDDLHKALVACSTYFDIHAITLVDDNGDEWSLSPMGTKIFISDVCAAWQQTEHGQEYYRNLNRPDRAEEV